MTSDNHEPLSSSARRLGSSDQRLYPFVGPGRGNCPWTGTRRGVAGTVDREMACELSGSARRCAHRVGLPGRPGRDARRSGGIEPDGRSFDRAPIDPPREPRDGRATGGAGNNLGLVRREAGALRQYVAPGGWRLASPGGVRATSGRSAAANRRTCSLLTCIKRHSV